MATIKPINPKGKKQAYNIENGNGQTDRVLSLFQAGFQLITDLGNAYSTVRSTIDSRKNIETDNAIKLHRVDLDVQKEENRHKEEMFRLEQQWKKLKEDEANQKERMTFIREQTQKFQSEYDRYLAMDDTVFTSDSVSNRLNELRKVIVELAKIKL